VLIYLIATATAATAATTITTTCSFLQYNYSEARDIVVFE
jgi:hypothetical protein